MGSAPLDSIEANERKRLAALASYDALDTPKERDFDEIAQLASDICGTPIAVVNLIADERQFFKAEVGLGVRETPFESSFCAKAILEEDFLLVPDATKDSRFDCNPLVTGEPHLRFYAGAILKTADNLPIGTVCVLDYQPRELSELQQRTLRVLARQVMTQLELRRTLKLEAAARRAAQQGRARYKAIFESATDYGIVVLDRDGIVTDWNEGASRILGWALDEIRGQDVSVIFTPEDRDKGVHLQEMRLAIAQGHGTDERWHIRKNGERFWANGEMMPLHAEDGTLEGYVKVLRDRTSQRLADEAIRSSEKRWRELFENMGEGFFVAELLRDQEGQPVDYRFLEINPAFARQRRISVDDVGSTIRSLTPDFPQWVIDRYAETVDTGEPQTFEVFIEDARRWLEVRVKKELGDRFSTMSFDITDRKAAEERLALADERLKMSLDASDGVALWDWMLDTDLLHGDENFARMYGLDLEKTRSGLTMYEYQEHVVEEDLFPLRAALKDVFDHGAPFDIEYRIAVPGEALRWVECKGRLIAGADGNPIRFSGTAVDITKLKDAEHQKQLLMEEMAHRVKNSFAVVQAIASQTLRGIDPAIAAALQNRITALGLAQNVLLKTSWASTTIHALLDDVLLTQTDAGRFDVIGPETEIGPKAALSLSLLIHEMSTNAMKYGALSSPDGKVEIRWQFRDGRFELTWRESGGPPVSPSARRGFGSKLIGMGINGSRDVQIDYAP